MFETTLAIVAVWSGVLVYFWRPLLARWREPAFTQPIVIFESDDWGAGPSVQADTLRGICAVMVRHVNRVGEHPILTLGVILAIPACAPKAAGISEAALTLVSLADESQCAVLDALRAGAQHGVFALQLHGLTHFNQRALMSVLLADPRIAHNIGNPEGWWTETLPSETQSAWTDASTLPSSPLSSADLREITQREGAIWGELFHSAPEVAVPTTFVWNAEVEANWADIGVRVIVTPGTRNCFRNAEGRPAGIDKRMLNGDHGERGIRYVVRDIYFEPSLGHTAESLLEQVDAHAQRYRPALVEIHRFNFCGPRARDDVLVILSDTLTRLLQAIPEVRFISTQRLGEIIATRDLAWISAARRVRLRALLRRAREIPRFWKVARVTGLCLPLWLCQRAVA